MKNGPKYKRILLKLSGEQLRGSKPWGIDADEIKSICRQVAKVQANGVQLALVVGGGNIIRGSDSADLGITRASADYMGMLATMINSLALQDGLEQFGLETRMLSSVKAEEICEPYIRRRAIRHLEKGRVIILAGGTGIPFFTTDTTAAVRAMEVEADVLMKATKVDGVYSEDPAHNADAVRYDQLSFEDAMRLNVQVMDQTAITHCRDHALPILVFKLAAPDSIVRAANGEPIGTWIGSPP